MKRLIVLASLAVAGCSSSSAPPANTAEAKFVPGSNAIQVTVSDSTPASSALLVGPNNAVYPAAGINVTQVPHTAYNPAPTISLGLGGFSGNLGAGLGLGVPVGGPSPAYTTDQYISNVTIPAPRDYASSWQRYQVQVQLGSRVVTMAAPPPS
jgi:hypothetical protein